MLTIFAIYYLINYLILFVFSYGKKEQAANQVGRNRVRVPVMVANNRPSVAPHPSGFMNFPNHPSFPLQNNTHQFNNPFQQQHSQQLFFSHNSMNQNVGNQVLVHNTIQNISQLLQFHNQNQNAGNNVMTHQQQFGVNNQGNPFLPASVQTQNILSNLVNFQNQIIPQNHNFYMQHVNNHGQPRFVSPIMDLNASTQIHNSSPITNLEILNSSPITNVNGGWADSQHKNFTGHKTNNASHKRFMSHKLVKEKFGIHNGNMTKANHNSTVNSGSRNSTNVEKKVPSLKYTEQEIKQWREARKKHYPKSMTIEKKGKKEQILSDFTNQAATLRRQQLKEILAKQAELGLEVADVPSSYLTSPAHDKQNHRERKTLRERYKKGKIQKKRGPRFPDNRISKRTRQTHEQKPNERESSLLQKLLTLDIKRDKNHLLQIFRFIAANSFFNGETDNSLRFPSVIVRETNPQATTCSVSKGSDKTEEEEEGEITD